jgi:uncharacterized protein YndB with AHSA1/START domain
MIQAVDVAADGGTIYRALTTGEGLAAFWTADSDARPEVGSTAVFRFPAAPVDLKMRIESLEPDRRVAWHCEGDFPYWQGTTVSWELGPASQGAGKEVVFRHEGWGSDYPEIDFARVNWVWGQVLGRLKAYCESGEPQPFFPAVAGATA